VATGWWYGQVNPAQTLPLVLRWQEPANPLPLRRIQAPQRHRRPSLTAQPPPWLDTGTPGLPFDFCGHMRRLCADMVRRSPALEHVDVSRLLFAVTQARNGRGHGLQARVTPLRFRDGRLLRRRRGVCYQVQRYFVDAREVLYVVTFCLPRFLDQDFDDKFVTIFHELYHISPAFDGDLRRHDGRCAIHTRSQKRYDQHMAQLAREYLATRPDPSLHAFLRLDFHQLQLRHGSVLGVVVPRPKLIPVPARDNHVT
jgi:hypothetical protein